MIVSQSRPTYRRVMASVSHFYLLTDIQGYAGDGCKAEYDYAVIIKAKRIVILPSGQKWTGFELVPNGLDDPCRSWVASQAGDLSGEIHTLSISSREDRGCSDG